MQSLSEKNIHWIETILDALDKSDIAAVMSNMSEYTVIAELLPYKIHLMGLAAVRIGNYSEALSFFKQASDARPEAQVHFEACGICAAKLGMLSDSLYYMKLSSTCEIASDFDQKLLPDWMGKVEDQVANIEERPFYLEAQNSFAAGSFQKTLEHLQQALNADPFNVDSWLLIYETMLNLDRKFDAIQAVKAAIDSGNVPTSVLMECAYYAAQLGLDEDVQNLVSLADQQQTHIEFDLDKLNLLAQKKETHEEYLTFRDNWISSNILEDKVAAELPYLGKKVRLGIFSSRLELNGGTDPIVNFLLDICDGDSLPWLNLYIYSNTKFMDVNTRRLASVASEFRTVDDVDFLTLSRIMKNDGLHFLWDLDGIDKGGKPQIHKEFSIPFRWVGSMNENSGYNFMCLNQTNYDLLSCVPFSLPNTFRYQDPQTAKAINVKRFAIPFFPNQFSAKFFDLFKTLRKKYPNFTLVLDTKRIGGVSNVDNIEQLFTRNELQNFIEFIEPYESATDYHDALFGRSDYIVVPEGADELQLSYLGVINNCRILAFPNDIGSQNYNSIGNLLPKRMTEGLQVSKLMDFIIEEFEDDALYFERCHDQFNFVTEFNLAENRSKRIDRFGTLLKEKLKTLYGDDFDLSMSVEE